MKSKFKRMLFLWFASVALAACGGGGGSDKPDLTCRNSAGVAIPCNETPAQATTTTTTPPIQVAVVPQTQPETPPVAPPVTTPSGGSNPPVQTAEQHLNQTEPIPPEALGPDGYAWGFAIHEFSAPVDGWKSCMPLPLYVWGNGLARVELVHYGDVTMKYGSFAVIEHGTFASLTISKDMADSQGLLVAQIVAYDEFGNMKQVMPARSWWFYDDPDCNMRTDSPKQ